MTDLTPYFNGIRRDLNIPNFTDDKLKELFDEWIDDTIELSFRDFLKRRLGV